MDSGSVSQTVQGCPSFGMAERGEGSGGCNRGDGLPPVPGTPSQQGSRSQVSKMDGQTPEVNTMPQQQQQQPATTSKCVTECTGMCEHDQTWMQVVKGIRCRDVNKETCP